MTIPKVIPVKSSLVDLVNNHRLSPNTDNFPVVVKVSDVFDAVDGDNPPVFNPSPVLSIFNSINDKGNWPKSLKPVSQFIKEVSKDLTKLMETDAYVAFTYKSYLIIYSPDDYDRVKAVKAGFFQNEIDNYSFTFLTVM